LQDVADVADRDDERFHAGGEGFTVIERLGNALKFAPAPPRVLIVVEGGGLTAVIADAPVAYSLKDFDTIREGGGPFNPSAFTPADLVVPDPAEFDRHARADVPAEQMRQP
jgi:hypothetical protein